LSPIEVLSAGLTTLEPAKGNYRYTLGMLQDVLFSNFFLTVY